MYQYSHVPNTVIKVVGSWFLSNRIILVTLTVLCKSREPGIGVPDSADISLKWDRISGIAIVNLPESVLQLFYFGKKLGLMLLIDQ